MLARAREAEKNEWLKEGHQHSSRSNKSVRDRTEGKKRRKRKNRNRAIKRLNGKSATASSNPSSAGLQSVERALAEQ